MNQFKYNVDPSINKVFIYGFGFTGKWLTSNIDRKVDGFIDTDIKKRGEKFNGVEVFSYEDAKNFVDPKTEIII